MKILLFRRFGLFGRGLRCMLGRGGLRLFRNLKVAAALALPERHHVVGSARALVDSPVGRDNLAAADGASAPAYALPFKVKNYLFLFFSHKLKRLSRLRSDSKTARRLRVCN